MSCETVGRRFTALGLALTLAVLPLSARAQPAAPAAAPEPAEAPTVEAPTAETATLPKDAAERFARAKKLYKDGKFEAALPLFESLADETDSPNARLYVGHCRVKLGRDVAAYRAFTQVLGNSTALRDDKYDVTREAARTELFSLERRVAKLVIAPAETPAGLTVTLDAELLDARWFGVPYAVEPGDHRVEAKAPGMQPTLREVRVGAGESSTLSLALKPDATPVAPPPPPAPVVEKDSGATLRMLGFGALGIGAAGLSVFTIAGLSAKSVHDELESECPNGCTDGAHRDDVSRGKTLQTTANAGLAVGLVGAATGAVLLWIGSSRKTESKAAVSLAPGGGVLTYRGRF